MASKKKSDAQGFVTVYCNLPNGISFTLPGGHTITFSGYPVSRLVSADGGALPAGRFGVTKAVKAEDWAWIAKNYAETELFKKGLIFAEADEASGRDRAQDHAETRHGMEQANVWNRAADGRLPRGEATDPAAKDRG